MAILLFVPNRYSALFKGANKKRQPVAHREGLYALSSLKIYLDSWPHKKKPMLTTNQHRLFKWKCDRIYSADWRAMASSMTL